MRALFVPLSACLLLSGCALPLMQAASSQMMPGMQTMPGTSACVAGTTCPGGIGTEIAKGVSATIQNLTGLASAAQSSGK
jgi:hypothetical protein